MTKVNRLLKIFEDPYKKTTELSIYQSAPSHVIKISNLLRYLKILIFCY